MPFSSFVEVHYAEQWSTKCTPPGCQGWMHHGAVHFPMVGAHPNHPGTYANGSIITILRRQTAPICPLDRDVAFKAKFFLFVCFACFFSFLFFTKFNVNPDLVDENSLMFKSSSLVLKPTQSQFTPTAQPKKWCDCCCPATNINMSHVRTDVACVCMCDVCWVSCSFAMICCLEPWVMDLLLCTLIATTDHRLRLAVLCIILVGCGM